MDRPFHTLFTPKIVIPYAKYLLLLASQPIFNAFQWFLAALLSVEPIAAFLVSNASKCRRRFSILPPENAFFLQTSVDSARNRPLVTLVVKIGAVSPSAFRGKLRDSLLQKYRDKLREKLLSSVDRVWGIWFWVTPLEQLKALDSAVDSLVQDTETVVDSDFLQSVGDELSCARPWRIFVGKTKELDSVAVFAAKRFLVNETDVAEIAGIFCQDDESASDSAFMDSQAKNQESSENLCTALATLVKDNFHAATYLATLDLCQEHNEYLKKNLSGVRWHNFGKVRVSVPGTTLTEIAELNGARNEDILHVGLCHSFQEFHERHGSNRLLDNISTALMNPGTCTGVRGDICPTGRIWFPTLNGPPETRMKVISSTLDYYGNNGGWKKLMFMTINKIPEEILTLPFKWTFGVTHVDLSSLSPKAAEAVQWINFGPGSTGGLSWTFISHNESGSKVCIEGDSSFLKSSREIDLMCRDFVAEVNRLCNSVAIAKNRHKPPSVSTSSSSSQGLPDDDATLLEVKRTQQIEADLQPLMSDWGHDGQHQPSPIPVASS